MFLVLEKRIDFFLLCLKFPKAVVAHWQFQHACINSRKDTLAHEADYVEHWKEAATWYVNRHCLFYFSVSWHGNPTFRPPYSTCGALALARFNSTLQVPDLTQEQAGQKASDTVRPIKFYHTKLAKSMLAYTKQNIPNGLNTMSNIFKEMEAKGVNYNLDTWVYKLQFYALRKDNKRMLKTFDSILERYTPSVDVFNIVTKVSNAKEKL